MIRRLHNLILVWKDKISMIVWWSIALFLWAIIENFSNRPLIAGNFWSLYGHINFFFDIVNVLLIAIFVASFSYKRRLFGSESKNNKSGWIGSFTSVIVSGCPSCSITLASYLGLASFFTLLPYGGLELKIIGTLVLLWSVYTNIKDLTICKRK